MLLLDSLVAYFSRKNYSQRQIILKILRVWERSLISVPIGVYFGLIKVGIWLGESIADKGGKTTAEEGLDARTGLTLCNVRSVHQEEMQLLKKDGMMNSVPCMSSENLNPHPIRASWIIELARLSSVSGHEKSDASGRCLRHSGALCLWSDSRGGASGHLFLCVWSQQCSCVKFFV